MSRLAYVILIAVVFLSAESSARAAILAASHWNSGTSLDYTAGNNSAPTAIGSSVAITTGSGGKFGEGITLPAGGTDASRVLDYNALGNINKAQGTLQFWFKPGVASATYSAGRILTIEDTAAGSGRLVDIYLAGAGSFDSYVSQNGQNSHTSTLTWGASDWLYFAFVWNNVTGQRRLWVGVNSGSATNGGDNGQSPWTLTAALPSTMNFGSFDGTVGGGAFSRGTFDEFQISDEVLFNSTLSSIAVPTAPFAIPEPTTALALSVVVVGFSSRRNRRV
jgi:hypothetical protein